MFPLKVSSADSLVLRQACGTRSHKFARPVPGPTAYQSALSSHFVSLGNEFLTFSKRMNEFPEFTDEAVNAAVLSLEGDLKVRILTFAQSICNDRIFVVLGLVTETV